WRTSSRNCYIVRSGAVGLIVVDSVAALVPKAELEGEIGDNNIGLQAQINEPSLTKAVASVSKTNCTIFSSIKLNENRYYVCSPETTLEETH
ncbi:recA bacterial DNA recombination family protein, partial [Orientia tsutsugamushi str. UT76]